MERPAIKRLNDDRRPFTPKRMLALPAEAYAEEGSVFFLTTRALPHTRPFDSPARCRVILDVLAEQRKAIRQWVGPYCLMPDHFHFVAAPGASGVSVWELLRRFHGASTNRMWPTGWKGKVWQPRGYDHQVSGPAELEDIASYIFANPVRAGLVAEPDDWPWSGWMDPVDDEPAY
jgi:REP element-mobilizing transposase RayT